jgi:hypothetical protein
VRAPPIIIGMAGGKISPRKQFIAYGTAIVLVVGCCFGARFITRQDNGGDAAAGTPTPSALVSAAQYSDLLAQADSAIGTDFRRLDTTSAKTLAGTIPVAAQSMYAQAERLRAVRPPTAAATHRDLVTQLSGFSNMIQRLGTDQQQPTCPAAATTQYGSLLASSFADGIRADATALARADPTFVFGKFLPPVPPVPSSRPATGTLVTAPAQHGSGQLKIKNGGGDTAISLVPTTGTKTPLLTVFVRAGSDYTVDRVGTGTYEIYYASGRNWNPERKGFTEDCTFSRFDETFAFRAYPVIDTWSITMTAAAGGTATVSNVDPDDFPTS